MHRMALAAATAEVHKHLQVPLAPGRLTVRGRSVAPSGIFALLIALTSLIGAPAAPASAQIFQVALIDATSSNFTNANGDQLNVALTLLANSDGIPGNASSNIDLDTVYARTGQAVWFG